MLDRGAEGWQFDTPALALTLECAVTHNNLQLEVNKLRRQVAENPPRFAELQGTSPPMQELFRLLHRASDTVTTVLITGDSGVGKELVARALHQERRRKTGPCSRFSWGSSSTPAARLLARSRSSGRSSTPSGAGGRPAVRSAATMS